MKEPKKAATESPPSFAPPPDFPAAAQPYQGFLDLLSTQESSSSSRKNKKKPPSPPLLPKS